VAHRLQALTRMRTAERNRLHAAGLSRTLPAAVRHDVQCSLHHLQRAIERLTREALLFLAADPQLARRAALLLSVRQWVAYAGPDARQHQSELRWPKNLRSAKPVTPICAGPCTCPRWWPCNMIPTLRGFYQHLRACGKAKLQALVAVMRKLLHAIFGMFKHDQTYDGSKIYPLLPQPESVCT
jgi:hypothetical protein